MQLEKHDIIKIRWCSILVSEAHPEDGAKNPSKGISMKFLVLAADAQSGVGAGSKNYGRPSMAWRGRPIFRGGTARSRRENLHGGPKLPAV